MAYKQQSPIVVIEGGTGATSLIDHGVLLGSGTGAITPLAAAATGETLMGNTGSDPSFTGSPSFSGTVTAGTGLIATTGGINAQGNSGINTSVSATNTTDIGTGSTAAITIGNNNTLGLLHVIAGAGGMTIDTSGGGVLLIGGNVSQGAITINSRTSALSISNDAFATTVNIATGAGVKTTTLGSTNSTSSTTIQSGSGALNVTSANGALSINSGTGALEVSTDSSATTVSFATGGAVKTVTLGSTNSTSKTTVQAGSQGITLTGAVTSANAITITSGNMTLSSGNLLLPTTTSTVGQIVQNGSRIFHTFGTNNVFAGSLAGNFTLTSASECIGIGVTALDALTTGDANTAVGYNSGTSITSGDFNTLYGGLTGQSISTGRRNNILGYSTGTGLTTGESNVIIGYSAGNQVTTGNYNIFIGHFTGSNGSADSNNIFLNHVSGASESNTCRIGNGTGTGDLQINKTFIYGIRGITTTNADAIAVLIDSAGQLGTISSSIRYKENIQDLPETRVLELRPVRFNYKQDGRIGTGLIAEEVEQIMPQLVALNSEGQPESVKYHDLPVFLLAEIQKLEKRIQELEKEVRGEY